MLHYITHPVPALSLFLFSLHTPFCYLRQMQQMFIVDKSFNNNAHYKGHLLNYYAHTIELTSHRHIKKNKETTALQRRP